MSSKSFHLSCPIPISDYPRVLLAHGGGGKLMHDLIEKMFVAVFDNDILRQGHDAALLDKSEHQIAMTTDSYVVQPLFFPGGNIGCLSVYGTVNDLSMRGANPRYISVGFIIEEGLLMEDLWTIVCSMKQAADETGVLIVTGDTKVVEKGKGDGLFINTAGIGFVPATCSIHPENIRDGDYLIVNGDIGRHGMAVLAQREGLSFETTIQSDCAPLNGVVRDLLASDCAIHCLRDLTRGGLATTLNEIAKMSGHDITVEEGALPVHDDVKNLTEVLGLDPLYSPCEGRMVAFVAAQDKDKALEIMRANPHGRDAAVIGQVQKACSGKVLLKTPFGVERILDMLSTDPLPRIC